VRIAPTCKELISGRAGGKRPSDKNKIAFREVVVPFWTDHFRTISYGCAQTRSDLEGRMLLITSAECRAIAEKKLSEAGRNKRHRRRLTNAAEGWLFVAGQLRRLEKSLGYDEVEKDADIREVGRRTR
jgi:hypothetical protein